MRNNKKILQALLFSLIIIAAGPAGGVPDPGEYFRQNVIERKLANGITLLMVNRGYSPIVSLHIAFRVGSSDESYNTTGAAHILEHMLFKGTDKLGTKDYAAEKKLLDRIEALGETIDTLKIRNPGSSMLKELEAEFKSLQDRHAALVESSPYDRLYTSMGGVGLNASTSRDMTGYYVHLPSVNIESWAKIESERLRYPVFREYYRERDNVLEERHMRNGSDGSGYLNEAFFAAAYMAHPYRHPVIGWESAIKFMSINDIRRFYNTFYVPSRMTITIVGKQDTEKTYQIVKKYFEPIDVKPEPDAVKVIEPPQTGEKRVEVFFNAMPLLMMGWKKPAPPHRDDYVFDVISSILGDGSSSRLHKSLVIDKKLATSVYTWNGAPGSRYDNMFMVYAAPAAGVEPERLEQEILAEIRRLGTDVKPEEFERVKNQIESSFIFMLDNNNGIARQLSYHQTIFGDWRYLTGYTGIIEKITSQDITEVLGRYINDRNRVTAILRDSRSAQ